MSPLDRPGPSSLAELQARFSAVLRTPPAQSPRHAPAFAKIASMVKAGDDETAFARLDVYRQQYWSRLHNVMVEELPLTRWLLGERSFQTLCLRYLQRNPPSTFDLHEVTACLPEFLGLPEASALLTATQGESKVGPKTLINAVTIDVAYGQVFLAPAPAIAEPWSTRPDGLKHRTLPLAPHARVIWVPAYLLRQRAALLAGAASAVGSPPPPETRDEVSPFLLLGSRRGVRAIPLPPTHAELLERLQTTTLEKAVGDLQRSRPEQPARPLLMQVQRWLANDTRLGIFRDQPRQPAVVTDAGERA